MSTPKTATAGSRSKTASEPVLEISNLQVAFHTAAGPLKALRGVDLSVNEGEIVALVGESGSGKTLTGLSVMRLIDPPGEITEGSISYRGMNVLTAGEKELLEFRGGRVAMIFQEPMTALNPVFTVGYQIVEVLKTHLNMKGREAKERAIALLDKVGIPEPGHRFKAYPFQLSGGMRQRAMIAMALAARPGLIIADEPTTALDVTIQAQILSLLKDLAREENTSILMITHDLGIVAQLADRVAIMYAGEIMESGSVKQVITKHRHPYTEGLFNSLPAGRKRLKPIRGVVPPLSEIPEGCPFQNRCDYRKEACSSEIPLRKAGRGHEYLCVLNRK